MLFSGELSHSIIKSLEIKIKWEMQRTRGVGFAIFSIDYGISFLGTWIHKNPKLTNTINKNGESKSMNCKISLDPKK